MNAKSVVTRSTAAGALLLALAAGVLASGPKGTVPRANASLYPAHAERDGASAGAVLLTADQVKRNFAADLARCCLVLEVALYPAKDGRLDVSLNDFTLRVGGTDVAIKPSSPRLLAATLQKTAPARRDVTVSPSVGIGYESGRVYDPATGRTRGGGVYTSAGAGVGVGDKRPASSDSDREVMELELGEKGLPEGTATAPVAGYVYFSTSARKKGNLPYQLEYTLNGSKLYLRLP